jgi:hypothetical protein
MADMTIGDFARLRTEYADLERWIYEETYRERMNRKDVARWKQRQREIQRTLSPYGLNP